MSDDMVKDLREKSVTKLTICTQQAIPFKKYIISK